MKNQRRFGNVLGGERASPQALKAFSEWHECVSMVMSGDTADIARFERFVAAHVRKDVLFCPPTYFGTYTGRAPFSAILQTVGQVFGPKFKYLRQILSPDAREWFLEFETPIADSGKIIRGIDLVQLDENDQIKEFRILAAPPSGVLELKKEMGARVRGVRASNDSTFSPYHENTKYITRVICTTHLYHWRITRTATLK